MTVATLAWIWCLWVISQPASGILVALPAFGLDSAAAWKSIGCVARADVRLADIALLECRPPGEGDASPSFLETVGWETECGGSVGFLVGREPVASLGDSWMDGYHYADKDAVRACPLAMWVTPAQNFTAGFSLVLAGGGDGDQGFGAAAGRYLAALYFREACLWDALLVDCDGPVDEAFETLLQTSGSRRALVETARQADMYLSDSYGSDLGRDSLDDWDSREDVAVDCVADVVAAIFGEHLSELQTQA